MIYREELIAAMERELTDIGFRSLKSREAVSEHFTYSEGTTLLVVNALCGCVGPEVRLGVRQALEQISFRPHHLVTTFPGVDEASVSAVLQEYIKPYPISSPAIAILQGGKVVCFFERYQLKGYSAADIAMSLMAALESAYAAAS